ncbi:MAG: restriction endonuclease subunit S [Planctomycetota bacterium]
MQYSIVNYKTVKENSDFRIDGEYYHPVCLDIHEKIKSKNGVLFFSKIKSISSGKNLLQNENGKYKFIRTQNIRPILIDDIGMSYTDNLNGLGITKEGEMLFVRVGEGVGNNSIITKDYSGHAISDNVLRLEIADINPFFCSAFFNSKIGQIYFKRVFKGTARSLISQENFKDIFIPVFNNSFQSLIQNLIERAQNLITKSQDIYKQAENSFLSELDLLDWKPKHQLSFIRNFSNTRTAERIDAEYFQPQYEEVVKAIKSVKNYDILDNIINPKKCFEPGSEAYQDLGIPFVRVSNLSKFGINDNNQQFISEDLYESLKQYQPKKGEILLSKDASPGIAYYLKGEPGKMIPSSGILRLTVKNTKRTYPEYLTLVLNSIIVQKQIERDVGGSILNHWLVDQVKNTLIPILSDTIQKQISDKVEKSFIAREQSKRLLDIAKQGVEMAIEKDEKQAQNWINSELKKLNITL